MLTESEKEVVRNCLENYPKGVHSNAWGYGPMQKKELDNCPDSEDEYSFFGPSYFDDDTLEKFG